MKNIRSRTRAIDRVALNSATIPHTDVSTIGSPHPLASTMPPGSFSLDQRDAVEWLRSISSESVDLVVTDPPYESLEKHRAIGTTTRLKHSKASSNDWFSIFPNKRFEELFRELWRVLKRNAHLYLFCDAETMFVAKPIGEVVGFKFWKPLVWDKKRIGMGYHYRARYEFILFFEKGKRKLEDLGISDIIEAPRVLNGYPTEKPDAVSDVLIRQSSRPGEIVMDPFAGSGSVGVAAVRLGRSFRGNDLSAEAVRVTRERLLAIGATEALSTLEEIPQSLGPVVMDIGDATPSIARPRGARAPT